MELVGVFLSTPDNPRDIVYLYVILSGHARLTGGVATERFLTWTFTWNSRVMITHTLHIKTLLVVTGLYIFTKMPGFELA